MASTLTLTLVLAMLCTGDVWGKLDLAPFSLSNATNDVLQYSHNLTCSRDEVIVVRYLTNGYKTRKCLCGTDLQCCQFSNEDCYQLMPPEILPQVTMECWGKNHCRPLVTKPPDSCQKLGKEFPWPTYSRAVYYCVPANTVVDMTRKSSASGHIVTAMALPVGLPHGHSVTCSVRKAENSQEEVRVIMDAQISQGAPPLSCLHKPGWTLCEQDRTAEDLFPAMTPFTFTLQQPANSSMRFAWVTLHGLGEHPRIRVWCEPGEATPPSTVMPSADTGLNAGTVALLVAGLVAGLVAALAAISVVFLWRRRWRLKKGNCQIKRGTVSWQNRQNHPLTSQTSPDKDGKTDSQTLSMSSSA